IARQKLIIDALSKISGVPIAGPDDVPIAIASIKRGHALCNAADNTLLDVTARNGDVVATILPSPAEFILRTQPKRTGILPGATLTDRGQLDTFLASVWHFQT